MNQLINIKLFKFNKELILSLSYRTLCAFCIKYLKKKIRLVYFSLLESLVLFKN